VTAVSVRRTEVASCRNVSVSYGQGESRVNALVEVDLTLEDGASVAIAGPSGSGKTTLLHVLGGLITPTSGTVTCMGQPLSSLDSAARGRARARVMAYVFQGTNLLPNFTAFENVSFAIRSSGGADGTTMDPDQLLGLVGLSAKRDALPAELSGGEAQRVAIARALAQRPRLLLCDEPTGHLDSDTGTRVLDLIEALKAQFGFTLVTATHDPDVAARSQKFVRLLDGQVTGVEEQT
jgi:ABC-type lipoprotein export system ATPase subunit